MECNELLNENTGRIFLFFAMHVVTSVHYWMKFIFRRIAQFNPFLSSYTQTLSIFFILRFHSFIHKYTWCCWGLFANWVFVTVTTDIYYYLFLLPFKSKACNRFLLAHNYGFHRVSFCVGRWCDFQWILYFDFINNAKIYEFSTMQLQCRIDLIANVIHFAKRQNIPQNRRCLTSDSTLD